MSETRSNEDKLRNVQAYNEARKRLNALRMTGEARRKGLQVIKKAIEELNEKLLATPPELYDGDELPLINEDTITPAGTAKLFINLDDGANAFQMLISQVQTSLTAEEYDEWVDLFLAEAAAYERTDN